MENQDKLMESNRQSEILQQDCRYRLPGVIRIARDVLFGLCLLTPLLGCDGGTYLAEEGRGIASGDAFSIIAAPLLIPGAALADIMSPLAGDPDTTAAIVTGLQGLASTSSVAPTPYLVAATPPPSLSAPGVGTPAEPSPAAVTSPHASAFTQPERIAQFNVPKVTAGSTAPEDWHPGADVGGTATSLNVFAVNKVPPTGTASGGGGGQSKPPSTGPSGSNALPVVQPASASAGFVSGNTGTPPAAGNITASIDQSSLNSDGGTNLVRFLNTGNATAYLTASVSNCVNVGVAQCGTMLQNVAVPAGQQASIWVNRADDTQSWSFTIGCSVLPPASSQCDTAGGGGPAPPPPAAPTSDGTCTPGLDCN